MSRSLIMSMEDRRARHDRVVALFRKGKPRKQIAKIVGLSYKSIQAILARRVGSVVEKPDADESYWQLPPEERRLRNWQIEVEGARRTRESMITMDGASA